ncbi:hypothetical protein AHAS_Ahas06G0083100 [Arachis hypogaea]
MGLKMSWGVLILFGGDFNDILMTEERAGCKALSQSSNEFKEWVDNMELLELELLGRKFMWYSRRSCSRIDRVFVDSEWLEAFDMLILKGLNKSMSDHFSLLVNSEVVD